MATMPGLWTEHKNAAGRPYWYNTMSKQSVWEKPDALKSSLEKALAATSWKETEAGDGKKYYYHKETKETMWEMPSEVKEAVAQAEKEAAENPVPIPALPAAIPAKPAAPNLTPGANLPGAPALTIPGGSLALVQAGAPGPIGLNSPVNGNIAEMLQQQKNLGILPSRPNLPEDPIIPHNGFATYEEGEKAFFHLLRKGGVDPTWTWEQTMRAVITDPLFKALNTLAEKKSAFQKFVDELRKKEREDKEARLAKLRPALRNMLKGNPMVHYYTTFQTADKTFAQHPIWQQGKIEAERKLIFEEYITELKTRDTQQSREQRIRAVNKVVALFKAVGVTELTRWRQSYRMVTQSEQWENDEELRSLPALDVLLAFEDYSRLKEREFEENTRRVALEKTQKERKAREGFKQVLQELLDDGKIKAKMPWKAVYPLFKDDERYIKILGNPGSTPLELYWDVVDQLDQVVDLKIAKVEEVLKEKEFQFSVDTKPDQFLEVFKGAELDGVSSEDLVDIHSIMHNKLKRILAEEQKKNERRTRKLQEEFRYGLKKADPPIDLDATFEDVETTMKDIPEYEQLDDASRRSAFAKFVKRQKEKLRETLSEDGGSVNSRKRKERPDDRREASRDAEPEKEKELEKDKSHVRDGDDNSSKKHRGENHDRRDRDRDRDRERDRERDRDRDYREREKDRERGDRDHGYRDKERSRRDSHRDRDRGDRDRDREGGGGKREKDRDDRRASKSHRDYSGHEKRREDRAGGGEGGGGDDHKSRRSRESREQSDRKGSVSVEQSRGDDEPSSEKKEKEKEPVVAVEERVDRKRSRESASNRGDAREDSPEEGEI